MTKFYRAIKIAFQYMFRNFGLSFASVIVMTLSFFIVSVVGITFFGSYRLVQYVDSKPALVIFLRGDLTDDQAQKFTQLVNQTGLARSIDIKDTKYSEEDFLARYPDPELREKILSQGDSNLFPRNAFVYGDTQENLREIIPILEKNEDFMANMIDKTNADKFGWYHFDTDLATVIRDANKLISVAGGIITLFLFVISSILIFITVKLTINYHKRELEIMDLVGADGWFIRLPFVIGGIIYGVLGAVISTTIIFIFRSLIVQSSQSLIPRLTQFFGDIPWPNLDTYLIIDLYLITILVGAIVGASSSFFAIIRYVKK